MKNSLKRINTISLALILAFGVLGESTHFAVAATPKKPKVETDSQSHSQKNRKSEPKTVKIKISDEDLDQIAQMEKNNYLVNRFKKVVDGKTVTLVIHASKDEETLGEDFYPSTSARSSYFTRIVKTAGGLVASIMAGQVTVKAAKEVWRDMEFSYNLNDLEGNYLSLLNYLKVGEPGHEIANTAFELGVVAMLAWATYKVAAFTLEAYAGSYNLWSKNPALQFYRQIDQRVNEARTDVIASKVPLDHFEGITELLSSHGYEAI